MFLAKSALAGPCEEVAFSNEDSFHEAMTKGLVLRPSQEDLMRLYISQNTRYRVTTHTVTHTSYRGETTEEKENKMFLFALNQYPELNKPLLREQIIDWTEGSKTESFRLRTLSTGEVVLRSFFGGSRRDWEYFKAGLNPNFFYFTLTDSRHRSSGVIKVELGTAEKPRGQSVKVAVVTNIAGNVQTDRIKAILEGMRRTLKEEGYILSLAKKFSGYRTGLVDYMLSEIFPDLKTRFENFLGYTQKDLPVYEFESPALKNVQIRTGRRYNPQRAREDFTLRSLYDPILSLKESKNEEDQLYFLSHLLDIRHSFRELGISKRYIKDHLGFVMKSSDFSFKVRKQALQTMLEWLWWYREPSTYGRGHILNNIEYLRDKIRGFSAKEEQVLIEEMSDWKNTGDWRAEVIRQVTKPLIQNNNNLTEVLNSPWHRILDKDFLLIQSIKNSAPAERIELLLRTGVNVNATNSDGRSPLLMAVEKRLPLCRRYG